MRAGIYCRISQDSSGEALGVGRQREDCTDEAEKRGWLVADFYVDNDVSATRSKIRPEYQRMLRDVASDRLDAIVVWSIDRLTRTPSELETIIAMSERHGVALASVGGQVDLGTTEGRMLARTLGAFARFEVENMSKRLSRKFAEKAQLGEPHGYSPYGYMRVHPVDDDGTPKGTVKRDVVHPEHGDIVREAATRVLACESLRSIVTDFNARGIHGPKAVVWNSTILRQILLRPTNAGLRQYRGRVVGPSTTEPLYDEDTYTRLVALLTDPSRKDNHAGSSYKYLLSGLAICGLCGGPMRRQIGRVVTSKRTGSMKRQPPSYNCSVCYKVRRHQEAVDGLVVDVIVGRLSLPDAHEIIPTGNSEIAQAAQAEIAGIDAKLAVAADDFADEVTTREQFIRITARYRERRHIAEMQLDGARPRTTLTALVGGDVRAKWNALAIEAQRGVLSEMASITILPTGSGKRFDPNLIRVNWSS